MTWSPPRGGGGSSSGVTSISKSGSTALTGAVTYTAAGIALLTQSGQNLAYNVPTQTDREHFEGGSANIANTVQAVIPWVQAAGTSVLDLTDPLQPILAKPSGIYCVVCDFAPTDALTAGGSFQAYLSLDVLDQEVFFKEQSAAATASVPSPHVTITACYWIPIGATINAVVLNNDGVATRHFGIALATIQRIT